MKWFKNVRIKYKLLISFLVVIMFAILLGGFFIITINRLDKSYSYIIEHPQKRNELLMQINTDCSDMRRSTTAVTLNMGNNETIENYRKQFDGYYLNTINTINSYIESNGADTTKQTAAREAAAQSMTGLKKQFESYKLHVDAAIAYAITGDFEATNDTFLAGAPIIANAVDVVAELIAIEDAYMERVSNANTAEKSSATLMVVIVLVVIVALSILIVLYISGLIAKPLGFLSCALEQFGFNGDTELPPDVAQSAMDCVARNDEIGVCAKAFGAMMEYINGVSQTLNLVADGDLTADVKVMSKKDNMGNALNKMVNSLNTMFCEIRTASDQVSAGANQVSMGAQQLASGSSEQAASIEEFSATLSELQDKTNRNAENCAKASSVNNETDKRLAHSIQSMGEMLRAMKEIDESSGSITKIIKVIDDIAFQTNILALNAAVEAARAGQHGKGFAVVADEVRNLASKSAAAAKETAVLIEGSSQRVSEGNQIVMKTNADLDAAAQNANESTQLIDKVTAASSEQAGFIQNINSGIEQISSVVQENSATAQESAAAAQEMSAQASVLNEIVSKFKLKDAVDRA